MRSRAYGKRVGAEQSGALRAPTHGCWVLGGPILAVYAAAMSLVEEAAQYGEGEVGPHELHEALGSPVALQALTQCVLSVSWIQGAYSVSLLVYHCSHSHPTGAAAAVR